VTFAACFITPENSYAYWYYRLKDVLNPLTPTVAVWVQL